MGQPTTADPGRASGTEAAPSALERLAAGARGVPPAVQGLLALVVYLAIWVGTETYPLLRHPGTPQLAQGGYDPNFYVWALHWLPYALGHGLNPLQTSTIGLPGGVNLAWVTTVPPLALLIAPLTLTAGPVAAFSVLVVAAVPLSGWGAFVLCRRLTGRFWASLAGGAVYGFSAFEINHSYTGQINLSVSVLLPLIAYLMVAWRDGAIGSRTLVIATALALTVQAYLFLETFADLTALFIAGFAVGAALAGRAVRPLVGRLALRTGLAWVIALLLTAPFVGYALKHQPPGFTRETTTTSIALNNLVVPLRGHDFGLGWLSDAAARLGGVPGRDGYLGVPLVLLALALPLTARASRLARFLLTGAVIVIAAALGPVLRVDNTTTLFQLPWARVWSLPVATSAYPSRLMVFAFLALSVAVALWLALPGRRGSPASWARWLLAALALAALAGNINPLNYERSDQPGFPAFIASGAYQSYIAPDAIVVVISQRGNAGLLWQAETGSYFRLAGGFVNAAISAGNGLPGPVAAMLPPPGSPVSGVPAFRRYLAGNQIADILVEGGQASGRWPSLFKQAGLNGTEIGGVYVYPVAPPPPGWPGGPTGNGPPAPTAPAVPTAPAAPAGPTTPAAPAAPLAPTVS
ncbi:MAG TPA: hypothetical protein VGM12_12490 [Trebonia sp.]|jgi:hypothetical protein